MTQEEVLKLIQDSDLDDAVKTTWTNRIESEGLTPQLFNEFRDAFQKEIDKIFDEVGATEDTEGEEHKAEKDKMLEEVEAANAEFTETMNQLSEEAKQVQDESVKAADDLQAEAVKISMNKTEE